MSFAPLLTYSDAYEHLLDVFHQSGKDTGRSARVLRRAIVEAYRILPSLHDWEYYRRTYNLNTVVPSSYSSAVYTAADNLVTLTGETWPGSAEFGSVVIDSVRYPIASRISDTVVEIQGGPGEDVTETMRYHQFRYLLPLDVGDVTEVVDSTFFKVLTRKNVPEIWFWQETVNTETYPLSWCVFPSESRPGRYELWLTGTGAASRSIRYMYRARNTGLSFTDVESSTANGNVSVSGTTATFSQSILNSNHVGAVLRISSDTSAPTSQFGRLVKNTANGTYTNVINVASEERLIASVSSSTEAILTQSATTASTKGFSLSPHIDLNYEGMWELFLRICEEHYDIMTRAEAPIRRTSKAERMQALRIAMGADGPNHSRTPYGISSGIIIEETS